MDLPNDKRAHTKPLLRTKVEEAHKTSRKYIADKALQGAALEIWMLIPKQNMLISQEDIKKERKKTWKPYKVRLSRPCFAFCRQSVARRFRSNARRLTSRHCRNRRSPPRILPSQVPSFAASCIVVASSVVRHLASRRRTIAFTLY
ncbi:hypothetical protein ACOSQ3_024644 [Xanthoceras sorbifolium]